MAGKRKVQAKAPAAAVSIPTLDNGGNYETWKSDVLRWTKVTSVAPSSHALIIHFSLNGKAKVASDQIPDELLSTKDGVDILLAALDKIFLPHREYREYKTHREMKRIHRLPGASINDFLVEYDQLYTKFSELCGPMSDSNAAYSLLEACRLPQEKEDTIMANIKGGNTYPKMQDALTRLNYREYIAGGNSTTSNNTTNSRASSTDIEIDISHDSNKNDEIFYMNDRHYKQREKGPYQLSNKIKGRWYNERRRFSNQKPNSRGFDRNGRPTTLRCYLCDSPQHLKHECPYNKQLRDLIEKKGKVNFAMFVGCTSNQAQNTLQTLVNESNGYAILDSGCSTTVCGEKWLSLFVETLSEEDRLKIDIDTSAQTFTFGDGKTVVSKRKVTLPCWMGGVEGQVTTDVVDSNIPLLLSRQSMKSAGMILDFKNDKVTVGRNKRDIKLKVTKSGHYALPLSL